MEYIKRPKGITFLSLFLGWLSLAGFGNAYMMMATDTYGSPILGVGAFVYGVLALIVCVGLWKMRPWSYRVFLLWTVVVGALGVTFQFTIGGLPLGKVSGIYCGCWYDLSGSR